METKNFRVHYQINGQPHQTDFSMEGTINNETKRISAWSWIQKAHPNIRRDSVTDMNIEDLEVW